MTPISTLTSYSTENPFGEEDLCTKFEIPNTLESFTLEGVAYIGTKYAFHCWVKSETVGNLEILGESISTSPEWKRYAVVFTAESADMIIKFPVAGVYYLYHPKLEIGTKSTDYTPAPEDMASGKDLDAVNEELLSVYQSIATVDVKADGIAASVTEVKKSNEEAISSMGTSLQSLEKSVTAKMSPEAVEIEIKKAMENGASKVVTTTGYTLNENGLTVEKSGREMKTVISENGMTVYQNGSEVLVANNHGVDAKNLNATTYLIVGGRSRFENFGSNRTGCFWIGGS